MDLLVNDTIVNNILRSYGHANLNPVYRHNGESCKIITECEDSFIFIISLKFIGLLFQADSILVRFHEILFSAEVVLSPKTQ